MVFEYSVEALTNIIVIDAELSEYDSGKPEIIQLAIIDGSSETLFSDNIKPTRTTSWPNNKRVGWQDVKSVNYLKHYEEELACLFRNTNLVIGYNVDQILASFKNSGVNDPVFRSRDTFDVMLEFAKIHGTWDEAKGAYRWTTLKECAKYYNCQGISTDSLGDCKTILKCFNALIHDPLYV